MPKKLAVLPPLAIPLPLSKVGEPQSWARKWCRVCVCAWVCGCVRACAYTCMCAHVCVCDHRVWVTCIQRQCSEVVPDSGATLLGFKSCTGC